MYLYLTDKLFLEFIWYHNMKGFNQGYGIVLNRMYVGGYLELNIGHEVINLYQADNGRNYIYLNSTGDFVKSHQGQMRYMLFVKYHAFGEVEVLGMACDLKDIYCADHQFISKYNGINWEIYNSQRDFVDNEPGGVSYGGVSIFDIFGQAGQQSVYITYKAEKVYVPKEGRRLFIRFNCVDDSKCPKHEETDFVVVLKGYQQAKASLKQYIYPEGTYSGDLSKQNIDEKRSDYCQIRESLIDNIDLWQESDNRVDKEELSSVCLRKKSLFDICQINNDENKFSNALAYFMIEYKWLWKDLFIQYGLDLGENLTIAREESAKIDDKTRLESGGRIDLLIRSDNSLVVVENKIKSDINSIENDGEGKQLRRYYNYVNWLTKQKDSEDFGKKAHFFILTPKYNIPTIEDAEMARVYTIITYSDVYNYLTQRFSDFEHDSNFVAFYEAMYRHTHENVNDYLYYDMQEKFFRRIKELTNN